MTTDCCILELFREWIAALRYAEEIGDDIAAEDEFAARCERARGLRRSIVETPAEGVAGLAVKWFLLHHQAFRMLPPGYQPADDDPCEDELFEPECRGLITSTLADIARLVPELAPLCAPALAEEAVSEP